MSSSSFSSSVTVVVAAMQLLIPFQLVLRSISQATVTTLSCPRRCSCDQLLPSSDTDSSGNDDDNTLLNSDYIRIDCSGRLIATDLTSFDFDGSSDQANVTVDLDLSRNNLRQLPLGSFWSSSSLGSTAVTFDHLRRVDLSSNEFESLVSGSLSEFVGTASGPRAISLADNEIVELGPRCFIGLDDVAHLTLSGNRLANFDATSFVGLSRLERLELDRNQLDSLPISAFACLPSLRNVTLSHNRISFVDQDTFSRSTIGVVSVTEGGGLQQPQLGRTPALANASQSVRYLLVNSRRNAITPYHCHGNPGGGGDAETAAAAASNIQYIDLSYNFLRTVPVWGQAADSLVGIVLDGNPIRRLDRWSFHSMSHLVNISISMMPELMVIDRWAFVDVPRLAHLHLHGNRRLGFIDPDAFDFRSTAPRLYVSLHDNALQTVPDPLPPSSTMRLNSTSTALTMNIGGNPFHCDCNVRWIRAVLAPQISGSASTGGDGDDDNSLPSIVSHKSVLCDSPTAVRGKPLADLRADAVSAEWCAPVVIPFFEAVVSVAIGVDSTFSIDCRAIGRPRPRIHWILPNGRVVNVSAAAPTAGSRRERLDVDATGTLTISGFRLTDYGTYTCVAMNDRGYDAAATTLRSVALSSTTTVDQSSTLSSLCYGSGSSSTSPRLLVKTVSSTFVAVTWSGADALQNGASAAGGGGSGQFGYSIIYRELDPVDVRDRSTVDQQRQLRSGGDGRRSKNFADGDTVNDDSDDDDDSPSFVTRVPLRAYMRAFTATNLRPLTTYEFCIVCDPFSMPTSSRPGVGGHDLPASPLSVGRRRQQQQQQQQVLQQKAMAAASSDSCIRVRTIDRRAEAVFGHPDHFGDDYFDVRGSLDATTTRAIRTVFGATLVSAIVAVVSLCGLLVCVRRLRTRRRRFAYADPAERSGSGVVVRHRDDWLARLNSADGDTGTWRAGCGNGRKLFGGRATLIPMNNLVDLPSTNLSSSRTSLLHAL
jgi:Leucine-rich repeat (LRR) protein